MLHEPRCEWLSIQNRGAAVWGGGAERALDAQPTGWNNFAERAFDAEPRGWNDLAVNQLFDVRQRGAVEHSVGLDGEAWCGSGTGVDHLHAQHSMSNTPFVRSTASRHVAKII